jgi:8-oxo-dGTP pyrophosphatase MutT (NUDIX family)
LLRGHLTGSALVVDPASERMLLLHHRKLQKWLQPGGHADGDGNLAAVALREATEETGIEACASSCPRSISTSIASNRRNETPHLHYDVRYLVLAPMAQGDRQSSSRPRLRWVTLDELDALSDEPGLALLRARGLAVAREVAKSR